MEILNLEYELIDEIHKYQTFNEFWSNCTRADWMILLAEKLKVEKKLLVKTSGRCAATVKHLMNDKRSLDALQACEDYGNGKINDDELSVFAASANDAIYFCAASESIACACIGLFSQAASASSYAARNADKPFSNELEMACICRSILTNEVLRLIKNK